MTNTKTRPCRACGGQTHGEPSAGGVITVCDECGNCVVYGEDLTVTNPIARAVFLSAIEASSLISNL
jgi:hypothetical protein